MQKRLHACASQNTCCGCRAACKQFVNSCIWHLVSTFCAGGSRRRGLSAPLRRGRAHLWAAVLASSTPPPCIQLRTLFMPPSGSSFRLLPLLWMLSWIPNINKTSSEPLIPRYLLPLSASLLRVFCVYKTRRALLLLLLLLPDWMSS